MLTNGIRLLARGLYAAADLAARAVDDEHGPWCEASREWNPPTDDSLIVPVRISGDYLGRMAAEDGWQCPIKAVLLRPAGDGTNHMLFAPADEIDLVSNRSMQRTMLAALDLAEALDACSDPLPDDVVLRLGEFKRAARSRHQVQS